MRGVAAAAARTAAGRGARACRVDDADRWQKNTSNVVAERLYITSHCWGEENYKLFLRRHNKKIQRRLLDLH
jgi:hypothetical protein